jgi:hypothetical protein
MQLQTTLLTEHVLVNRYIVTVGPIGQTYGYGFGTGGYGGSTGVTTTLNGAIDNCSYNHYT